MFKGYFRRGGLRAFGRDLSNGARSRWTRARATWLDILRIPGEFRAEYRKEKGEQGVAPPPRERTFLGFAHTVLVNSITILGVFKWRWTVGTALALYWAENLLTGLLIVAIVVIWRRVHAATAGELRTSTSEVALMTLVFNAAHLAFLFVFLGVMLPDIAPAERFDRTSFTTGIILIAVLLALNFVRLAFRARTTSAMSMQQAVLSFTQRVAVLHLTIILGMFALALFGQARAFFAVFAGLKVIVDLSHKSQ